MTTHQTLKPGDAVVFKFGCTDSELFGTLLRICTDRQGRPAALIGVAGFPEWQHVEPLAGVTRAPHRPALFDPILGRFVPRQAGNCTHNCRQGRDCTCQAETVPAELDEVRQ